MDRYLALKEEIGKLPGGMSDADIATALNAPDASRPVPKPLSIGALMALFSPASRAKLRDVPALAVFREDVVRQDRPAVANWLAIAASGDEDYPPAIQPAEFAAAMAELQATVAGPSKATQIMGVPVTSVDVAAARSR